LIQNNDPVVLQFSLQDVRPSIKNGQPCKFPTGKFSTVALGQTEKGRGYLKAVPDKERRISYFSDIRKIAKMDVSVAIS
jgi:hypothetical protein